MEDWELFSDSRFALQFGYPARASDGEPVNLEETRPEGMLRVHILAPKCREVYTLHGHKLRLFTLWEAQFVTRGIIF